MPGEITQYQTEDDPTVITLQASDGSGWLIHGDGRGPA